jgi:hypothetical protein
MRASTIEGTSGARLEHEQFPHVTRFEWEGLHRLSQISGKAVITALLSTGTEQQHRLAAQEFMVRELADARRQALTSAQPKMIKADIVKLDVSSYNGEGVKRMALNRWFCEIDSRGATAYDRVRSDQLQAGREGQGMGARSSCR